MEKDLKQKTLSFNKGVCLNPSEMSCDDNELSVCDGLLFERGELHVIQKPEEKDAWNVGSGKKLVGVHDYGNYTHLLFLSEVSNVQHLWWADKNASTFTTVQMDTSGIDGFDNIEAIGNTLVVSTNGGIRYFLWSDGAYKDLGSGLPELKVKVGLKEQTYATATVTWNEVQALRDAWIELVNDPEYGAASEAARAAETAYLDALRDYRIGMDTTLLEPTFNFNKFIEDEDFSTGYFSIKDDHKEDFKNAVVGIITGRMKKVREEGWFCNPFWVRVGLRMYDESVVSLTAPMLMYASVGANFDIYRVDGDTDTSHSNFGYRVNRHNLYVDILNDDLWDWRDLINGVVVYVTEETSLFDINGEYGHGMGIGRVVRDSISARGVSIEQTYASVAVSDTTMRIIPNTIYRSDEIIQMLIDKSVFYELAKIDLWRIYDESGNVSTHLFWMDQEMTRKTLANLTTQPQLPHDDYYGHCPLNADTMMAYNGRLQLGGLERGFFNGYSEFSNNKTDERGPVSIYVTIAVDDGGGDRIVKLPDIMDFSEKLGHWFFYPDRRAKKVTYKMPHLTPGVFSYKSYTLREHPYLNGAYYFGALPYSVEGDDIYPSGVTEDTTGWDALVSNAKKEQLPSVVATSEVNNPWYFPVDGWNTVGSGKVVALSSTTDALSEGQFGVFPLLAFTDEGVWALSLRKDGLYDTTAPISREVCLNGKSVVQTDDAVYFISEKGLMRVSGRTVKCVSEQLDGKECVFKYWQDGEAEKVSYSIPSVSMDKKTRIAYDYKFGRLWLYKEGVQGVLVYSLKTGAFATLSEWSLQSHAILYPDTLIQDSNGAIWSMLGTKDENEDEETYDVRFLSRPVKMGDLLHFKSMRRIEHHALLSTGAGAEFKMWGSDDLREWFLLDGFRGRGWKYFRFGLAIESMNAVDVYAGMTTNYLERQTGRLHGETIINNE